MLITLRILTIWNIYIYTCMKYSMQTTPYFNQKISLGKIAQNRPFIESKQTVSMQNNHISWEDPPDKSQEHQIRKKDGDGKPHRRRIFDKFQSKIETKVNNMPKSRSKSKQGGRLIKVKSHPLVTFQQIQENTQPDARIQQINRQLKQHRQNITSSRVGKYEQNLKLPNQDAVNWAKIQQKLTQSKQILRRQQQMLITKIPTFQKKIEDNNAAITEVTKLIRLKLDNESKKMQDLYMMMEKNGDRIKTKEEELSRINSELLLKESQIMRNKEINKRRELELQRIKRIEDLQNKNIEIYQEIEKKDQFSQLQDHPIDPEQYQCRDQCWGECEQAEKFSKLSVNKISTIQYSDGNLNSYQGDDTIGELLSPLALIDNQYLV